MGMLIPRSPMWGVRISVRCCYFLALLIRAASAGVLADSTMDFSGTQGAKNWYYGYFPAGNGGAFTQLTVYDSQSQLWKHTTFGPPWTAVGAGSLLHPTGPNDGAEEWGTREWMSPYAGPVTVSGHLAKLDTSPNSDGIYGRIYWNHQLIYEQFIVGTDGVGQNYSLALTLNV